MIGRLCGILLEKQAPLLLIDVGGVGYEVLAPMTTCFDMPMNGETVTLHTHFSVTESAQQLFGFSKANDRAFFRLLIKVNGVGPKMAIGIMSMDTNDIARHIRDSNTAALVKVPGVGKKTAERLIVDLRDKLTSWGSPADLGDAPSALQESLPNHVDSTTTFSQNAHILDAESALIALGYKPAEAAKAISRVRNAEQQNSETLIRLALKSMLPN